MFWRIVMILLLIVLGLVAMIKAFVNESSKLGGWTPPPTTVELETVDRISWEEQLTASGTIEALDYTVVASEVAGQVSAINFRSGRHVEKGQVLIELNPTLDRAQLGPLQTELDLAKTELARTSKLAKRGAISRADLERAQSRVASAQAALDTQDTAIDKKVIRAPYSGELGISTVDLGEYLRPGDPIVTLSAIDTALIGFSVPERHIGQLREGLELTLTTDAYPGVEFPGRVQSVENRIDMATRNVLILGAAENADHRLKPGMFVSVVMKLGTTNNHVVIPRTAVSYNTFGNVVYAVNQQERQQKQYDMKMAFRFAWPPIYMEKTETGETTVSELVVTQKFVQTGETRGELIAVTKGLEPGDRIVTAGSNKGLRNGTAVKLPDPDEPKNGQPAGAQPAAN